VRVISLEEAGSDNDLRYTWRRFFVVVQRDDPGHRGSTLVTGNEAHRPFPSKTNMDVETKRAEAIQILKEYYPHCIEQVPQQREKPEWIEENKFGFLLGVLHHGTNTHVAQLHSLLSSNSMQETEAWTIHVLFEFYIGPFHDYFISQPRCRTPLALSSSSDGSKIYHIVKELSHSHLRKQLLKRDGGCLFCWQRHQRRGVHVVTHSDDLAGGPSLFDQTGIAQMHSVQNGLLLCGNCRYAFSSLSKYVDIVDQKMVVKVVNATNDEQNQQWKRSIRDLKMLRAIREEDWTDTDKRQSIESNGEMALYFVNNDPALQPNRKALEFHKAACLIWRMAGGAVPDYENCSDDGDIWAFQPSAFEPQAVNEWRADNATLIVE
jgi:hypothetical protein